METSSATLYHLKQPQKHFWGGTRCLQKIFGSLPSYLALLGETSFPDRATCAVGAADAFDSQSKSSRPGKVYQSKGSCSFREFRRMARRRYPPPTNPRPTVMMTDTRATRTTIEGIPLTPAEPLAGNQFASLHSCSLLSLLASVGGCTLRNLTVISCLQVWHGYG